MDQSNKRKAVQLNFSPGHNPTPRNKGQQTMEGNTQQASSSSSVPTPAATQDMNRFTNAGASSSSSSSSSIDSKMCNVAKLREQLVEEIKDIELSMKETIRTLKSKVEASKSKAALIQDKLKQANQLLCHQSEQIYMKEQKNKILGEKVRELYECQKIIFETADDISNTLNKHEFLADNLANHYDSAMIVQQNDLRILQENLQQNSPDSKLSEQLKNLEIQITEKEKQIFQNQKEINQLESDLQLQRKQLEDKQQKLQDLDKKIADFEAKKKKLEEKVDLEIKEKQNQNLKLKEELDAQKQKLVNQSTIINELNCKVTRISQEEEKVEMDLKQISNEIDNLIKENETLDNNYYQEDQNNSINLTKLQENLKDSKNKLSSMKNKESQATNVLQKKIAELMNAIKKNEGIEEKLEKVEAEKHNEEDKIEKLSQNFMNTKKEFDEKLKITETNISNVKNKISDVEKIISASEDKFKMLEKEIEELNEKLKAKKDAEERLAATAQEFKQQALPNIFPSRTENEQDKQKSRKKLYTPTLGDDDLDIDSLPIEEQLTQLTQSSTSSSPDKSRKFFKSSSLSQSSQKSVTSKPEATPRGRGRGKKNN
ncbi:hypothetical protein TKK_0016378 [Trichogramma kaykai]